MGSPFVWSILVENLSGRFLGPVRSSTDNRLPVSPNVDVTRRDRRGPRVGASVTIQRLVPRNSKEKNGSFEESSRLSLW